MSIAHGRIRRIFFLVCQAIFLVIAINGLSREANDQAGWLGLLGFMISFIPDILRRYARFVIPFTYEVGLMMFIFLSLIVGEYFDLYGKFLWWDDMLHFVSGLVVGCIALLVLHIDDVRKRSVSRPWLAAMFVFSLVLATASAWEIVEFSVDKLAHGHMQYGLDDTMVDIINAGIGALVMAVVGFLYYKFARGKWLRGMFDTFVKHNPYVVK